MAANDPIDFAEDGRLLADLGDDFADWLASDMVVECGYLPPTADAVKAMLQHAAAYREAVLAASEYRLMVRPKHGDSCECNESADRLDAALARFRNITETP